MTHGVHSKRQRFLLAKLSFKKTQFRLPFIAICVVILVLFLLSATFYSSSDLPIIGEFQPLQFEAFKNACVERTKSNLATVTRSKSESVRKFYPNATRAHQNATDTRVNNTGFSWDDSRLDILNMKIPPFDKRLKNPCWYEPLDSPNPYEDNIFTTYSSSARNVLNGLASKLEDQYFEQESPKRLRCLPYFLMIGQPKCGSTDLFWKIAKHGDILPPPIKELHWWSRNRQANWDQEKENVFASLTKMVIMPILGICVFGSYDYPGSSGEHYRTIMVLLLPLVWNVGMKMDDGRRFFYKKLIIFEDYVDMFDEAAFTIEASLESDSESSNSPLADQPITGEASVSLFWDNSDWEKFPENQKQTEPLYIIPHYIHHIIPDVKLILMIRDPVERLYSDYLYFNSKNKSADDFHNAVSDAVDVYQDCITRHSLRGCVYNLSVANRARVRLRVGLYSVYLKDWLKVFTRGQFFILRLEDYSMDQLEYIRKIHEFLGLRELTVEEAAEIEEHPKYNARKEADRELGGMYARTRALLQRFYRPFNEDLASILKDERFLWTDTLIKKKEPDSTVASTTLVPGL